MQKVLGRRDEATTVVLQDVLLTDVADGHHPAGRDRDGGAEDALQDHAQEPGRVRQGPVTRITDRALAAVQEVVDG